MNITWVCFKSWLSDVRVSRIVVFFFAFVGTIRAVYRPSTEEYSIKRMVEGGLVDWLAVKKPFDGRLSVTIPIWPQILAGERITSPLFK